MVLLPERWKWLIRFYYKEVTGKRSSLLAIETIHTETVSRDLEIHAGKGRSDIGRIELYDLSTKPATMTVVQEDQHGVDAN